MLPYIFKWNTMQSHQIKIQLKSEEIKCVIFLPTFICFYFSLMSKLLHFISMYSHIGRSVLYQLPSPVFQQRLKAFILWHIVIFYNFIFVFSHPFNFKNICWSKCNNMIVICSNKQIEYYQYSRTILKQSLQSMYL
jgi:hypothetical protein